MTGGDWSTMAYTQVEGLSLTGRAKERRNFANSNLYPLVRSAPCVFERDAGHASVSEIFGGETIIED